MESTNGVPSNRGGYRGNRPVFTKSGYALLIKPMKDQLAWDIYKHILQVYFQSTEQVPVVVDADGMVDVAGQMQRVINSWLNHKLDVNTAASRGILADRVNGWIVMAVGWVLQRARGQGVNDGNVSLPSNRVGCCGLTVSRAHCHRRLNQNEYP
jgi:hypothetical protein